MDRYDNDNGDDKCGLPNQVLQFGLVSSSICKPTASTWFGKLNYLQPLSWQAMSMEISIDLIIINLDRTLHLVQVRHLNVGFPSDVTTSNCTLQ